MKHPPQDWTVGQVALGGGRGRMKPGPTDFETKILDAAIDFFHEYEWIYNAYLENMEAMPQLAQEARFKLWDNTAKYLKKFGTER